MKHTRNKRSRRFSWLPHFSRRRLIVSACVVVGVFVLANAVLWAAYRERTYPRTRILGTAVGNVSYGNLARKASELKLLPKSIQLSYGSQKTAIATQDLGVHEDISRAVSSANKQRSWLPIVNLFKSPQLQAPVAINRAALSKKTTELANVFRKDAVDAHLELAGTAVSVVADQKGYELDSTQLESVILGSLDKGDTSITVSVKASEPKVSKASLVPAQLALQQQLATQVIFKYGTKTKQPTAADIAKWYVRSANTYDLSASLVSAYVTSVGSEFGIRVKDVSQMAQAAITAVKSTKSTTVTLVQQTSTKTYKYCTAVRGVDASNLPTLRSMLISTYGDSRGWSLGGLVAYQEVSNGCDYTVWLSAASQMPTFGGVCDSEWSCRSGNNVVINYDRWTGASAAWNANGGTIENYRHMVINHETGHWLGFGHAQCSGAGQLAPVMQQQSIDLHGCTFNPWPTSSELGVLKNRLGL